MSRVTQPVWDVHSEAWEIKVMDDDLTAAERVQWEAHLAQCPRCQSVWAAMATVEDLLRVPPPVPPLPVGFTAATVGKVLHRQRWQRLLTFLVGVIIVSLVTMVVFSYVGSALALLERSFGTVVAARYVLVRSILHTFMVVFFGWRAMLPFVLGFLAVAYIVLMPNGLLFTAALIWLSGRQHTAAPVQA